MIRNIQLRHAGKYTCAVQTKVDSISIAVDLVVRGEPQHSSFAFATLQFKTKKTRLNPESMFKA